MMAETPNAIQRIFVAAHPQLPKAENNAAEIADFICELGLDAVSGLLTDAELIQGVENQAIDLVITLGGDGTVLRAGHLCAPHDVPILGINRARFGFLIEVGEDQWRRLLPRLTNGEYWFEHRMMLLTEQWRGEALMGSWEALNEAFIGRGESVRPVHLVTNLDGRPATTYVADGLIVSTATGSTAYALAAGGPILPPELRNILIMPVAPHLSVDRAVVLPEGSVVSLKVRTGHEAVLSIDGQASLHLADGDRVEVRASQYTVRFLRFQEPGYFYRQILAFMDQNPSAGDAR